MTATIGFPHMMSYHVNQYGIRGDLLGIRAGITRSEGIFVNALYLVTARINFYVIQISLIFGLIKLEISKLNGICIRLWFNRIVVGIGFKGPYLFRNQLYPSLLKKLLYT
jgi:hypothetical protein